MIPHLLGSMPKTWSSEGADDAACPHCGVVYSVVVTRLPAKDKDFFTCVAFGMRMAEWNDTHSPSFTLKDSDGTQQQP
jgi:hypothetical protein